MKDQMQTHAVIMRWIIMMLWSHKTQVCGSKELLSLIL